jgi:hypothetical protein
LAAIGKSRPYRKQPIFLLLHLSYYVAQFIHPLPADTGKHQLARFQIAAFFV